MYRPSHNCFRNDLEIYQIGHDEGLRYVVKDPSSNQTYEFIEQELCLCFFMNGQLSFSEIVTKFFERFNQQLSEQDILSFSESISKFGLFKTYEPKLVSQIEGSYTQELFPDFDSQESALNSSQEQPHPSSKNKPSQQHNYHYSLVNPQAFLNGFGKMCSALSPLSFLAFPGLILLASLAFLCISNNLENLIYDLQLASQHISFPANLILSLLMVNLSCNCFQGSVITQYGKPVNELGIKLAFGFFPLFYIDRTGAKSLRRREKLWVYGSPIYFRLLIFSLSVLTWQINTGTQTQLGALALIFAQAAIIGTLLDANPLWASNGYYFLTQLFGVPNLSHKADRVLRATLQNKNFLQNLGTRKIAFLCSYGLLSLVFGIFFAIIFLSFAAITLEQHLQGLGVFLFIGLLVLILRWHFSRNASTVSDHNTDRAMTPTSHNASAIASPATADSNKRFSLTRGQQIGLVLFLGLVGVSIIPYQYRVGGQLTLLPPKRAEIQASTSGQLSEVFVSGGDGQLVEAGTVIATISPSRESNLGTPVEEDAPLLQQQILSQEAVVERRQAELNELLATPRPEALEVAQSAIAIAEQEFNLAQQNLATAQQELRSAEQALETVSVRTEFREQEANRLQELFNQGGISQQVYEDAEKLAAVSRSETEEARVKVDIAADNISSQAQTVEIARENVAAAQANLNLVASGPHPEMVNAARKDVATAEAQLAQQQQKLATLETQLEDSTLVMPFDGVLTTAFLDQKADTFIEQGDLFAIAENDQLMQGEMQVPEFEIEEFEIGSSVQTRLLAYPDTVIPGQVISIEPIVTNTAGGGFVKVIVEFDNTSSQLKSGMAGYAKIEGTTMPAIAAFTKPLVRFFQVEVWSWIP